MCAKDSTARPRRSPTKPVPRCGLTPRRPRLLWPRADAGSRRRISAHERRAGRPGRAAGDAAAAHHALHAGGGAAAACWPGLARACQVLGIFTPDGLTFADLTPAKRSGAVTLLLVDLFAAVGPLGRRGLGTGHVGGRARRRSLDVHAVFRPFRQLSAARCWCIRACSSAFWRFLSWSGGATLAE